MCDAGLSDIISAIPTLAEDASNWQIFEIRFRLALSVYGLYPHFIAEKNHTKLVDPISRRTSTEVEPKLMERDEDEREKWDKDEDISRYVLSRVIPDSMLLKIYSDTRSVHEMWKILVNDAEKRVALLQADLRAKFFRYRCPDK